MDITIDARGLSCPIPQQLTLKAIRNTDAGLAIIVMVDEAGARDSVIRTARALQLPYRLEMSADEYKIYISKERMMDRKVIDARGLTCPHPVMETEKVLRQLKEGTVVTIVDNAAARDNVKRLAESMGCTLSIEKKEDDYYLTLTKH